MGRCDLTKIAARTERGSVDPLAVLAVLFVKIILAAIFVGRLD